MGRGLGHVRSPGPAVERARRPGLDRLGAETEDPHELEIGEDGGRSSEPGRQQRETYSENRSNHQTAPPGRSLIVKTTGCRGDRDHQSERERKPLASRRDPDPAWPANLAESSA